MVSCWLTKRPCSHTCHYHRASNSPSCAAKCCEVYVHRIDYSLEVERNLYIQYLLRHQLHTHFPRCLNSTLEPTSKAIAVLTLTLVPMSPCIFRQQQSFDRENIPSPTFGHRYCTISFMIAQSAFRCSLFDTSCSVRSPSVLGAPSDFASGGFCTASGLMFSIESAFEGIGLPSD